MDRGNDEGERDEEDGGGEGEDGGSAGDAGDAEEGDITRRRVEDGLCGSGGEEGLVKGRMTRELANPN